MPRQYPALAFPLQSESRLGRAKAALMKRGSHILKEYGGSWVRGQPRTSEAPQREGTGAQRISATLWLLQHPRPPPEHRASRDEGSAALGIAFPAALAVPRVKPLAHQTPLLPALAMVCTHRATAGGMNGGGGKARCLLPIWFEIFRCHSKSAELALKFPYI